MKKQHVQLTETHKSTLQNIINKGKAQAKTYKRALALLELNRGQTYINVSKTTGVSSHTISIWARKYADEGLTFLTDKKRSGRPRIIDTLAEASITTLACSEPPEGYERWTLRLLAEKAVALEHVETISKSEVGRLLKKMNLSLTEKDSG